MAGNGVGFDERLEPQTPQIERSRFERCCYRTFELRGRAVDIRGEVREREVDERRRGALRVVD